MGRHRPQERGLMFPFYRLQGSGYAGWRFSLTDKDHAQVQPNGLSFAYDTGPYGWSRSSSGGNNKFYIEVSSGSSGFAGVGASKGNIVDPYGTVDTFYWDVQSGQVKVNGSVVATYATISPGDVAAMAVDPIAGKVWLAKNNVVQAGDPAAGTGGLTIAAGTYYPHAAAGGGAAVNIAVPHVYSPPTGFGYL